MTEEAKQMKPFTVVCTGPTDLDDGKVGMKLQLVKEDGTIDSTPRVFAEKSFRKGGIFVGGMYEVEANEEFTTARLLGAKYKGQWPDEADRTRWKTEERSYQIAREAKKRQADDKAKNAMIEALKPIREAYLATNSLGRLAIEVQVLAYLRGTRIV